jgi:misacylated tRNA(Ala) deacylase
MTKPPHIHRTDDTTNPLDFLSSVVFALDAAISPEKNRDYVAVLSSSPSTQTTSSFSTATVSGPDEVKVKTVGDGSKAKLGVKAGGKGPRWSGKYIGVWKKMIP